MDFLIFPIYLHFMSSYWISTSLKLAFVICCQYPQLEKSVANIYSKKGFIIGIKLSFGLANSLYIETLFGLEEAV